MKILIVSQYFYPENFKINDFAFSMGEKGHNITVITGIPNYPSGKFFKGYGIFKRNCEIINNVNIRRIPLISRGNGSGFRLFLNYFSFVFSGILYFFFNRYKKYDVVFVFGVSPLTVCIPAIYYKRLSGVPIILWVLDSN